MSKTKLGAALIFSFLLLFTFSFINSANASAKSAEDDLNLSQKQQKNLDKKQHKNWDQKQQNAVDLALDEVIINVNKQIEEGKSDIIEYRYVPEVNDFVGIEFSAENVSQVNGLKSSTETATVMATATSGIKSYRAEVNGVSFTHTLLGDFTYSGGKVTAASKDVLASGFLFSHTKSSTITKLDPSVWQVSSTVKHKYLGVIGGLTGTGYTSYIVINLYGSGDARLMRANYSSGV